MNSHLPVSGASQSAAWRQQVDTLSRQWHAWWAARSPQERRLLKLCMFVVAAALIWVLGLRPAMHSIEASRLRLPLLHADAAQVQADILEAQALRRRHTATIDEAGMTQALHTSLQRAGLQDMLTVREVRVPGTPATHWEILASNAGAARVMAWLADLPYLFRLRITEAELARANVQGRDRPGHVTGRILVRQAAKDQP